MIDINLDDGGAVDMVVEQAEDIALGDTEKSHRSKKKKKVRKPDDTPVDPAKLHTLQLLLIKKVSEAADEEAQSMRDCHGLLFFLIYVLVFVVILTLQMGVGSGGNDLYQTLVDNLFSVDVVDDGDGGVVGTLGGGYDDYYTWFNEAILAQVFTPPECGDGVCDAPEEYPQFQASDDARLFLGCKADCGAVATESVRCRRSSRVARRRTADLTSLASAAYRCARARVTTLVHARHLIAHPSLMFLPHIATLRAREKGDDRLLRSVEAAHRARGG